MRSIIHDTGFFEKTRKREMVSNSIRNDAQNVKEKFGNFFIIDKI